MSVRQRLSRPRRLAAPIVLTVLAALLLAVTAVTATPAAATPGDTVWTKRFSANARADVFSSVARGPDGSVYAAGITKATEESSTLLLVKYRDNGATATRLWVRTYRWPGRAGSEAFEVAVDKSGNAIVAGSIGVSPLSTIEGRDILVLKYGPGGSLKWAQRYDGPAGRDDYSAGLVLDAAGNAYVVGTSRGAGTGRDYVALKYRADGTRLWTLRYGGASWDDAGGIAIDGHRNTYITGSSKGSDGIAAATLKISPSGVRLWVKRVMAGVGVTHGNAIAVTNAAGGGVYVGGSDVGGMSTGMNMLIAKLSPTTGAVKWVETVGDTGDEQSFDLAVDRFGNAVSVGDTTSRDTGVTHGLVARVTAAGASSWTREVWLDAPGNEGHLQTVALGWLGGVYVGGFAERAAGGDDFLVRRFLADGTPTWTMTTNGSASAEDWCRDLALARGTVYAAGLTTTITGGTDALLVKMRR